MDVLFVDFKSRVLVFDRKKKSCVLLVQLKCRFGLMLVAKTDSFKNLFIFTLY